MNNTNPDKTTEEANTQLPQEQNDSFEKSKKLRKATPNWRKRLRKTAVAMALPLASLVSTIGMQAWEVPKETGVGEDHGDLPEIVYSTDSVPSYIYSMARDSFSYTMSIEAGKTIEDVFIFELGKHLAPELQLVDIQSLDESNRLDKVMAIINKYKEENSDFYDDLHDKYARSIKMFNKEKQIDESGKFLNSSEIRALEVGALMAELRL